MGSGCAGGTTCGTLEGYGEFGRGKRGEEDGKRGSCRPAARAHPHHHSLCTTPQPLVRTSCPLCLPACLPACLSVVETPRGACLSLPPPSSLYLRPTPSSHSFSSASLLYLPSFQLAPVTLPSLSLVSVPRATITRTPSDGTRRVPPPRDVIPFFLSVLRSLRSPRYARTANELPEPGLNYLRRVTSRPLLLNLIMPRCRSLSLHFTFSFIVASNFRISFTRDPTSIFTTPNS